MKAALDQIRSATKKPINLYFFTHTAPAADAARHMAWRAALASYYVELGLDPADPVPDAGRAPFDEAYCAVVEDYRTRGGQYPFRAADAGAPEAGQADRRENHLFYNNCGGGAMACQARDRCHHRAGLRGRWPSRKLLDRRHVNAGGTMALVPQIVGAVPMPVIAAGGIAGRRGVRAAFELGASAVQVGTAYLFTPEAKITSFHREALRAARDSPR